jgi:Development and cell death domain.
MKSYIFACNALTMGECLSRNLFGVAKPNVSDISIGDFCYLYNYDDKFLYGVWKAASKCGWHEKEAWEGKFKFQARVERISKSLQKVPLTRLATLIQLGGQFTWRLFGDKAQNLIQYFAHQFDVEVSHGEKLNEIEEDYRNRFPVQFLCEDGHRVRSLSEQTIDNWLFRHGLPHAYEPVVPIPEQLIPDFMVKDSAGKFVYIEFWGMLEDPSYKARMYRKSQVYADRNFPLIEFRPPDLQNLEYVFPQKLRQKNVPL